MKDPIIVTNPALCHDCYRCVRNCSVKAIRIKDGQAEIVPELCIVCGILLLAFADLVLIVLKLIKVI